MPCLFKVSQTVEGATATPSPASAPWRERETNVSSAANSARSVHISLGHGDFVVRARVPAGEHQPAPVPEHYEVGLVAAPPVKH